MAEEGPMNFKRDSKAGPSQTKANVVVCTIDGKEVFSVVNGYKKKGSACGK